MRTENEDDKIYIFDVIKISRYNTMLKSFAVPSGRDYSPPLRRWFRRETSESHAVDTPQCTTIFNICAIFVVPIIRLMYYTSNRHLADRHTHQYCDVLHQSLRVFRRTCKANSFMNNARSPLFYIFKYNNAHGTKQRCECILFFIRRTLLSQDINKDIDTI